MEDALLPEDGGEARLASIPAAELGSGTATPPAPGIGDGRMQRLDPRHVPCARLGGGLFALGLLLAVLVGFVVLVQTTELGAGALLLLGSLMGLLVSLVALAALIHPPLELAHSSWRLSDAALEIKKGVWFRHLVTVPRARVQHTDVERGPIERRFELATLVVHTAGHQDSEVRLEGLRHETALAVRDFLLAGGGGDGA